MRILQINHSHYIRGGADVVYFNTAKLLSEKGHDVYFFSKSHRMNGSENQNEYFVRYIDFHSPSFVRKLLSAPKYLYNQEAYRKVTLLVKKFKPDIAHIHLFYGSLTISILKALKEMNIPMVHTVHDYRLLCPVYSFLDRNNKVCEACKNNHYISCLKKRCSDGSFFQSAIVTAEAYFWNYGYSPVDLVDHFIFVSKFIQAKHIEYNPAYIEKSSFLYNFHNNNGTLSYLNSKKGNYILYFGRLSKEKGITTLLKAFSTENIDLIIAGKGPLEMEVIKYANKYGNITYVGFLQEESLSRLIQNAFFTIIPSEWYENNPMTIVESFSFGKPVIGSKIGGIPELIQDNKNGFLFQYGNMDSLKNVINRVKCLTENEYKMMSGNAQKFAQQNFDKELHYQSLMKIYDMTMDRYRSAAKK